MKKLFFGLGLVFLQFGFCTSKPAFGGVVNFMQCFQESKYGKQELENLQKMENQMLSMMKEAEEDLQEVSKKLDDTDYLDSISPKMEEELRLKQQTLAKDLNAYQNQFYQAVGQARNQAAQKLSHTIAVAAEKIAKKQNLPFVISKEACFYYNPDIEITQNVIHEMDRQFDYQAKNETNQKEEKVVSQKEEPKETETKSSK